MDRDRPAIRVEPFGGPGWRAMVALRERVLRAPLGLAFAPGTLAAEGGLLHLAMWRDGAVIGTVLVDPAPPEARLRQMAVAPERRGLGHGAALVRAAEAMIAARGIGAVRLHARCSAAGFYRRLGYREEGREFEEVGLPHIAMRRALGD